MDQAARPAPKNWHDDLALARADVAAGRLSEIDVEALCLDIEAEADALEAERRGPGRQSAA